MTTKNLNREEYIASVASIEHSSSQEFAQQSLKWWDSYYSWNKFPCLCLEDDNGKDVCYLFYHISRNNQYLTIHNILTPFHSRFKGYAKKLLTLLFNKILLHADIERVKMYCVSSSLQFYMNLGIDFWGVNRIGQYYTDFPMPDSNIKEIKELMNNEDLTQISTKNRNAIYNKLQDNGSEFNKKEMLIFKKSLTLLKERYRFKELKSFFI
jgi:hypothetical protein